MTQWLCTQLWLASERTGISLGRFAPWVFGKMIGASSWERAE